MRSAPLRAPLLAGLLAAALMVVVPGPAAQPAQPSYLSYEEFGPQDTAERVAVKRAYNEAAQRYNQTLYDYHVTLEKHDRLVELHNDGSADAAERRKARDQAEPLRLKLAELRREVVSRAALVDQARRRAAAAGVSITR